MQEDMVEAGNSICNIQITVSDDENAAYICIAPPSEGTENTLESVLKLEIGRASCRERVSA